MYVNNLVIIIVCVSMISKYIVQSTLVIADTLHGERDLVSAVVRVRSTVVRTKFPKFYGVDSQCKIVMRFVLKCQAYSIF